MKTKYYPILFASVFVLLPAPIQAQCTQWDVSGKWVMREDNAVYVTMNLQQSGTTITGSASFLGHIKAVRPGLSTSFGSDELYHGSVDGTVKGDTFYVQIYWGPGDVGIYNAKIGPQGRIEGSAYPRQDPNNPSRQQKWYSDRVMQCASTAAAPSSSSKFELKTMISQATPTPAKVIHVTGHAKVPASEPCRNWDARGSWKLTGQLHEIDMHLDQSGTSISGRATSRGDVGDVVGSISSDTLGFQIKWSNGKVNTFTGRIVPYNPIKGTFNPGAGNWSADRAMPCADSAAAAVTAPADDSAPVSGGHHHKKNKHDHQHGDDTEN